MGKKGLQSPLSMATRAVKSKADYNTLAMIRDKGQIPVELEEPLTPDAYDEAMPKRRWEHAFRCRRVAIRHCADIVDVPEAFGERTIIAHSAMAD